MSLAVATQRSLVVTLARAAPPSGVLGEEMDAGLRSADRGANHKSNSILQRDFRGAAPSSLLPFSRNAAQWPFHLALWPGVFLGHPHALVLRAHSGMSLRLALWPLFPSQEESSAPHPPQVMAEGGPHACCPAHCSCVMPHMTLPGSRIRPLRKSALSTPRVTTVPETGSLQQRILGLPSPGWVRAGSGSMPGLSHLPALSLQICNGLVQTTGWPSVVTCVGNWFGKGR